ncbi:o-succinylbenzoate synthase [Croceivirga thetidis]|uniref:O-succinylbenzoate synthase n=1 Tax=Croceivirga thetidis TaxID=2721623 RepID=A0ABX1GQD2_9FLAO|nr:o-succinylbenzoate synthase [Croceivirga thetidis]NKI32109.1 o-succinylbenzoate synthase [Croceivirga thetidis]
MEALYKKHVLNFKRPSGTSRGIMTDKETWFLILKDENKFGIGECGILRGLSIDDKPDYEQKLRWTCENISMGIDKLLPELIEFPSIQFGLEQAFLSLKAATPYNLFASEFNQNESPIAINGLVWMGDESFMHEQIEEKLVGGFNCIKMKVGAIDFEKELKLLSSIRTRYNSEVIELRVDANGAFDKDNALSKLKQLSQFDLHSIEQPIKPKQWEVMQELCKQSPLPIALDEELIGVFEKTEKQKLLEFVNPQYIILKPSLIGGFRGAEEWIEIAEELKIGWWVTSALESNVGLNAIAQWTYTLKSSMPQGLGTGSLFTNNFDSPLQVAEGQLIYRNDLSWQPNLIEDLCI